MKQLGGIYKHSQRDEWLIFYKDERDTYVRIKRYGDIIEYPAECFKDRIERYALRYPQYQGKEIRYDADLKREFKIELDGVLEQYLRFKAMDCMGFTQEEGQ